MSTKGAHGMNKDHVFPSPGSPATPQQAAAGLVEALRALRSAFLVAKTSLPIGSDPSPEEAVLRESHERTIDNTVAAIDKELANLISPNLAQVATFAEAAFGVKPTQEGPGKMLYLDVAPALDIKEALLFENGHHPQRGRRATVGYTVPDGAALQLKMDNGGILVFSLDPFGTVTYYQPEGR